MEDLETFLSRNNLSHLLPSMDDQELTLDLHIEANDSELCQIFPRLADKIKIRAALDKLRISLKDINKKSEDISPIIINLHDETESQLVPQKLPFTRTDQSVDLRSNLRLEEPALQLLDSPTPNIAHPQDWSLALNTSDLELLNSLFDFKTLANETRKSLRRLLLSISVGKVLLAKADKGEKLNSRDRAMLVKIIVEAEISSLDHGDNKSIRKNVWQQWSKEVVDLFVDESAEVYYVPYHVIAGKVIQASGLFHNRLITHRRCINSTKGKKRSKSCSSDSSDSGASSSKSDEKRKRVRPLPENFDVTDPASASSTTEANIEWLKSSSSPKKLLFEKWNATVKFRQDLISKCNTIKEYFSLFPGLYLPEGYELLSSDFEALYPNSTTRFDENFPTIKTKLLTLLAEKTDSVKPDKSILDLLNLASLSEEHANLAAFLSVTNLLRQMPTISVPRKKVWKLSREEVRSAFIARVLTADIDRYCADRQALVVAKGIPEQPYIIAVGASWDTVSQYEVVIFSGLRYPQKTICEAVKTAYHIYWALDCAYSKDSAPCWMFVQRTMFNMTSKFDTEGVPLRELLNKVK